MATLVSRTQGNDNGLYREELEFSTLTAASIDSTAHLGPTALAAARFSHYVKTSATSGDPVFLTYASTDTTNDELDYRFDTVAGGDLAGAVVVLVAEWNHAARQDGQSINSDNDA